VLYEHGGESNLPVLCMQPCGPLGCSPAYIDDAMTKLIRVVAAVIEQDGRYLITQRRKTAVLPLLWEFPGGRVEGEESDVDALQREVMHRLGAKIQCGALISFVNHPYEHYSVDLYLYACALLPGETLEARVVHDFKWVASSEFDRFSFTPADEASMTTLLGLN
jgi:8-oxo-dGTP diphosphatase